MRLNRSYLLLAPLVLILGLAALTTNTSAPPSTKALREVVLAQAQAELGLSSFELDRVPEAVSVERGARLGDSLQLWSGHVSSTGPWHSYVLASVRGRILRLGGFQAPELILAADVLRPKTVALDSVILLGRRLARLADPIGAEDVEFRTPDIDHPGAARPDLFSSLSGWFADSAMVRPDGSIRVRIAVVSRQVRNYATTWTPHLYAFEFGADGRLRAWSRLTGDELHAGSSH